MVVVGPMHEVSPIYAPLPDFAKELQQPKAGERRPRPERNPRIGDQSRVDMTSSRARERKGVNNFAQAGHGQVFVAEIASMLVDPADFSGSIDFVQPYTEESADATLELVNGVCGGVPDEVADTASFINFTDGQGVSEFYSATTHALLTSLQTKDGMEALVTKVDGLGSAKRDKLSDLKANACEEIGIGIYEEKLAEAGLMSQVRGCAQELSRAIFKKDATEDSVKTAVEKYVAGLERSQNGTAQDGVSEAWAIAGALKVVSDTLRKKSSKTLIMLSLAVSMLLSTCTPETKVVPAESIPASRESFGGAVLKGGIVQVVDEIPNAAIITTNAEQAMLRVSHPEGASYAIVGQSLVDTQGNRQPVVMGLIYENGTEPKLPTATPSSQGDNESSMYFYAEGDGLAKLVPPGQGVTEAGGRMIPLRAWMEDGDYIIGIATPSVQGYDLVPIYRIIQLDSGTIQATYTDPFSGYSYVTSDINNIPVIGREIAALDPYFGIGDIMDPEPTQVVPSATPDVMNQVYVDLQSEGINISHDASMPEGKFEIMINGESAPSAFLDSGGLHITLENGTSVDVAPKQVADRLDSINGSLILKDQSGSAMAVYNPGLTTERWGGRWVSRMEAINTDLDSPEKYIQVDSWLELNELRDLTLAFSPGFSDKAQWPPFDQIPKAYVEDAPDGEPQGDINWSFPFGHRSDPDTFLTALRNTVLLKANEGEGRSKVACLALQGVKNVDGSESLITFGYSGSDAQDCYYYGLGGAMGEGDDGSTAGEFAMPNYNFGSLNNGSIKWVEVQKASADRLGFNKSGKLDPVVKDLIFEWMSTGMFPDQLKELVFQSFVKMYY